MAVKKVFVRSALNYDTDEASIEAALFCTDESLTLQSQAEDADINVMLKRFGVTGMLPQARHLPSYGDFSDIGDYRSALDALRAADEAFYSLDADIRARFRNDPAEFLDFTSNPDNVEELRKMGLADPIPPDVVQRVEVVNGDSFGKGSGEAGKS